MPEATFAIKLFAPSKAFARRVLVRSLAFELCLGSGRGLIQNDVTMEGIVHAAPAEIP